MNTLNLSLAAKGNTSASLANPWALVPPLGNLDAYISAVNRLPICAQTQRIQRPRVSW